VEKSVCNLTILLKCVFAKFAHEVRCFTRHNMADTLGGLQCIELDVILTLPVRSLLISMRFGSELYRCDYMILIFDRLTSECPPALRSQSLPGAAKKVSPKIICCFLNNHSEFQSEILLVYVTILSKLKCQAEFNNL